MKHVPKRRFGGNNYFADTDHGKYSTKHSDDRPYSEAELTERTRHQARIGPCAPGTYRASNGVTLAKTAANRRKS